MAQTKTTEPLPVTDWLVLGAFPLRDRTAGRWTQSGFPCEADFAPQAGEMFNGAAWTRYETHHGRIENHDPVLPYPQRHWVFAYAFSYIQSPTRQTVRMRVGNDCGGVIWLNGEEVYRTDAPMRSVLTHHDDVKVTLRKGWNRLLFKSPTGPNFWGIRVHFLGAGDAGPTPRLTCSAKRPSAAAFPGLRRRRGGLTGEWSTRLARPVTVRGGLAYHLELDLFNDSPRAASRVRVSLVDARGALLAKVDTAAIPAFTQRRVEISVDAAALAAAFGKAGELRPAVEVRSSQGTVRIDLPVGAPARVLCNTMADLPITVKEKGDTPFVVPVMFAGSPARVEMDFEFRHDGEREYGWPVMPAQTFDAEQTRQRKLILSVNPPPGVPNVRARMLFGTDDAVALAARTRRLLDELGLDVSRCARIGAEGLTRMLHHDVNGAWDAVRAILDRVSAEAPDRGAESVTLVGHAHIDMNWLWTYDETVQAAHDTFRQVLAFCDEFPDFHFSQSQAAVYEMIERFDPGMFDAIRRRVAEGRWELLGGFLTEGDTNMSSGEALARSLLIGQRYFRSRFGKTACVGWLPDNFGHVAQLAQIHRLAGIRFLYAFRCQPRLGAWVCESPDGSRTVNFATPTYNTSIDSGIRLQPATWDPRHRRTMVVYGVGDHGGGPARRDIERARAYADSPGSPTIRMGTAESFFTSVEPHAADYPLHHGERQYTFEGCYTSIARIKQGNRNGENLMFAAEMLTAFVALHGEPYPHDAIHRVWHAMAFNQFHDILCGSATHDSNRESIARYDTAVAEARNLRFEGMRRLTWRIDTQSCGQPVVVFNPLPQERSDVAEAEVFSYQLPPTVEYRHWGNWGHQGTTVRPVDVGQGPSPTIHLVDVDGGEIPAQVVETKLFPNGHRLRVQFPADQVPACGYKVFHAFPAVPGVGLDPRLTVEGAAVETPHFRIEVNGKTGHLQRVYDKRRKAEVLSRRDAANVLKVYMEKPHGMSAWELGPIRAVHSLDKAISVKVTERGPVRAVIEIRRHWSRSKFTQRIITYRDVPRIDFELDVAWFELGGPDVDAPMLRVAFPLNARNATFTCDTPFAAVQRPATGQEVPAQKWVDLSGPKGGAALLNAGKYGHRCLGDVLEMPLLRASYDPDVYPDQGPHAIRYALVPHAGTWQTAGIAEAGLAFNVPMTALEASPHPGDMQPVGSFVALGPEQFVLSGVKKPEDGNGLIVRFYEAHGKAGRARLRLPRHVHGTHRVNLIEDPLPSAEAPTHHEDVVELNVHPFEIVTLRVDL